MSVTRLKTSSNAAFVDDADPPFSRLFPSTPSGTPKPYPEIAPDKKPNMDRSDEHEDDDSDNEDGDGKTEHQQSGFDMEGAGSSLGDEERLEQLGELEGMPESVGEHSCHVHGLSPLADVPRWKLAARSTSSMTFTEHRRKICSNLFGIVALALTRCVGVSF